MCILLVVDEWLIRSMVAGELAEGGFKVCEAENADQALTLIAHDPAVFTLLVTDIHMPGSLNGLEVASLLRARRPDLPVIYTTGRLEVLRDLQPLGTTKSCLRSPLSYVNCWMPLDACSIKATITFDEAAHARFGRSMS